MIPYSDPGEDAPREIRSSLALAKKIESAIAQGHRVAVLQTKTAPAGILAAIQLIQMGITANDAVDLLNVKAAGVGIQVHDEQFLWDLELVLDLCADNDQPNTDGLQAPDVERESATTPANTKGPRS